MHLWLKHRTVKLLKYKQQSVVFKIIIRIINAFQVFFTDNDFNLPPPSMYSEKVRVFYQWKDNQFLYDRKDSNNVNFHYDYAFLKASLLIVV